MKDLNEMTRKDFAALPERKWNEVLDGIDSIVLIPSKKKHDSGYACFGYVAVKGDKAWRCGGGDIIHIDGIGGYGKDWLTASSGVPSMVSVKAWNIDCLVKSGYLRLWSSNGKLSCEPDLSSMEVYSTLKPKPTANDGQGEGVK